MKSENVGTDIRMLYYYYLENKCGEYEKDVTAALISYWYHNLLQATPTITNFQPKDFRDHLIKCIMNIDTKKNGPSLVDLQWELGLGL
jgi:hypothetical protein